MNVQDLQDPSVSSINYLHAILGCLILIAYHGYIFGYSDQIETIPYLYALDHPGAYPTDFFIQHILEKSVHERWFYVQFLHLFGFGKPPGIFFLHLLSSFFLLLGLFQIAHRFIRTDLVAWAAVIFTLTISYHINLGGNELYYNTLIPSLPAKALATWSIFFAIKSRWWPCLVLLTLSTYLQPLVGLQVFLLLIATVILNGRWQWSQKVKPLIIPTACYLLFVLPWLWLLLNEQGTGGISNETYLEILEFRLSHHFFASSFPVRNHLIYAGFLPFALWYYRSKSPFVFRFLLWILIGCIVYVIGTEALRSSLFFNTQWFKATIWVKAFAMIAIFSSLEKKLFLRWDFLSKKRITTLCLSLILILLVVLLNIPSSPFSKRPYDLPFTSSTTAEKDISTTAGKMTQADAVFVVPLDLTEFKWYSKRNSYVDYKAMIHHRDVMSEWYQRVQDIYRIDLDTKKEGKSNGIAAKENLTNLKKEDLQSWKSKGIDYLLTYKNHDLSFPILAENEKYRIYTLTDSSE